MNRKNTPDFFFQRALKILDTLTLIWYFTGLLTDRSSGKTGFWVKFKAWLISVSATLSQDVNNLRFGEL